MCMYTNIQEVIKQDFIMRAKTWKKKNYVSCNTSHKQC